MIEVTKERIAYTEKVLLKSGDTFRDDKNERYAFISCVDKNIDVNACPGSGKTTCLLSKLIILAEHMPFPEGRGVCVLTHTNVAIDEIKNKLGIKSNKLFSYPNHFGTFQSFVDKFLALPFYRQNYMKPISFIDNDIYDSAIFQSLSTLSLGTRNYLRYQYDPSFIFKARFSRSGSTLLKSFDGGKLFKNDGVVFAELFALKNKLLDNGILCYDDAYFLAFQIISKCPQLKQIFSRRFGYVFVDEAQDSYPYQLELLEKLFDDNVIIQKIGDPDQAIMGDNLEENSWLPSDNALTISTSKRFSNSIAKVLKTVCTKNNSTLLGNDQIENIHPYIITYDTEAKLNQVLLKYSKLLKEHRIDEKARTDKLPIKAVGWVGDGGKDKLTIQSYFPAFNKELNKKTKYTFETLRLYLRKEKNIGVKVYYDGILSAVLKLLYIADKKIKNGDKDKWFSKTSLTYFLISIGSESMFYYDFLENVSKWSRAINSSTESFNQVVLREVREYFLSKLLPVFNITLNDNIKYFIFSDNEELISEDQLNKKNIYIPVHEELSGINIEIANVHSVKGETHAATLYLETSFFGYTCSEYILNQLIGIPYVFNENEKPKNLAKYRPLCLKMAYVGMSRPKYFLAFAASADKIIPNKEKLMRNGWVIVSA